MEIERASIPKIDSSIYRMWVFWGTANLTMAGRKFEIQVKIPWVPILHYYCAYIPMSKLWLIMHDFTSCFQVHTSWSRHKNSPSLHLKHLCIFFWTMHCLIFLHIIYNFVNNNTKYKDWCVLFYALNYFTLWFSFLSSGRRMFFSEDYGTKINPNLGFTACSSWYKRLRE